MTAKKVTEADVPKETAIDEAWHLIRDAIVQPWVPENIQEDLIHSLSAILNHADLSETYVLSLISVVASLLQLIHHVAPTHMK